MHDRLLPLLLIAPLVACSSTPEPTGPTGGRAFALPDQVTEVESALGAWRVAFRTEPAPIPLNEPFAVDAWVFPAGGDDPAEDVGLEVDAGMPQHRHGMNRQPTLERRDDGGFRAEGLLFHMPGEWTITFDVSADGITERAQGVVTLE